MNILIMGLPGSGKGTQSDLIVDTYHVKHLSTGNLFRSEMQSGSALGKELASFINQGLLVPDELTIRLLKEEISKSEYQNGFLLDGYPRNLHQAEVLDEMLASINQQIDYVLYLDLPVEVIVNRLSGRLFCPTCQKTYHETLNPPITAGVCDDDQTPLVKRDDDQPEKVQTRIEVSLDTMQAMLDYYQAQNKLSTISISQEDDVACVFSKIEEVLNHD